MAAGAAGRAALLLSAHTLISRSTRCSTTPSSAIRCSLLAAPSRVCALLHGRRIAAPPRRTFAAFRPSPRASMPDFVGSIDAGASPLLLLLPLPAH
jgi:hypothetical protein